MVAGAAFGMVLSMLFGFQVMPSMIFGAALGIVGSAVFLDRKPSSMTIRRLSGIMVPSNPSTP